MLFSLTGVFVPFFSHFERVVRCITFGGIMSMATPVTNLPTGARRMSLHMLTWLDRANQFTGAPQGTAKPMTFLGAFQEAEPYLGLPAHAFKLVSWLVKQTQPQDWEAGSRPIAWPSARRQQEFLGLSAARVKSLNRALFEAGIFVIRDSDQGKRYGVRNKKTGRVIEAYGFDLSPLAQRYDEFIRLAAAAKVERDRMRDGRRRITFAHRAIRQIGEQFILLGKLPPEWAKLEDDKAALMKAAKQAMNSEELQLIATSLERRKDEAKQWLLAATATATNAVDITPQGLENEPHTTTTTLTFNPLKDTVMAAGESSRPEPAVPISPAQIQQQAIEQLYRIKTDQLLDLAPRLAAHVFATNPTWGDIIDAAGQGLRHELGVSAPLWGEACRMMGRDQATLALAIVSTKPAGHFTKGAGGYFAGMLRKFEKDELRLDRTLWALKDQKWGSARRNRDGGNSAGGDGGSRFHH
jgi:replication initiation protein RepC